ncbi:nicotinate-nucleotide adenylyltransferase [Planctomicrobium sp. SH661]|uniref:nicotinate-nucleotide adenylyltransferase n=1 Tax=Planctomicrobium sp. SH661 TaxID=3448124 RepID=UPI003F5B21B5
MKIGIYGGSFDPIHLGHLLLAESAREACGLDQVWFIPAAHSPLKETAPHATAKQRVEMLRLALAGYPAFVLSDLEIKRKGVSYTVETLTEISNKHPDAELFLIMGADSVADFPRWKDPTGILELAGVIAVNRARGPVPLNIIVDELGEDAAACFQVVEMPGIEISSTEIRQRSAAHRSIRFQTPRAVEQYILQHKLYLETASTP